MLFCKDHIDGDDNNSDGGVNDDGDNHENVQAAKGPGITLKWMMKKNLSKELYSLQVFFLIKGG